MDTSGSANALQWRVLNATGGLVGVVTYGTGSSVRSQGSIGTQFTTNLTSIRGTIVSSITFTPTTDINNYTVQCRALDTNTPAIIGTDTCSITLRKGMYEYDIGCFKIISGFYRQTSQGKIMVSISMESSMCTLLTYTHM